MRRLLVVLLCQLSSAAAQAQTHEISFDLRSTPTIATSERSVVEVTPADSKVIHGTARELLLVGVPGLASQRVQLGRRDITRSDEHASEPSGSRSSGLSVAFFAGAVENDDSRRAVLLMIDGEGVLEVSSRVTNTPEVLLRISTRGKTSKAATLFDEGRAGGLPLLCGAPAGEVPSDFTPAEMPGRSALWNGSRAIAIWGFGDQLFLDLFEGDIDLAFAYMVGLFSLVSDIFERDAGVHFSIHELRLNLATGDIVRKFSNSVTGLYLVTLSGSRQPGIGGSASGCGPFSSSLITHIQGRFSGPAAPQSLYGQDVQIMAHELGHNFCAPHTHETPGGIIDKCGLIFPGPARRGTIMSYCAQRFSGGSANADMWFHRRILNEYIRPQAGFRVPDCNHNLIPDSADIATGTSNDANTNGVPDECEDCNGDGMLDPEEIASGYSADLNGNGRPDECEPDCNGNGVPDDLDISFGSSTDLYGNGVPDECEPDCDADGVSDYDQIIADMTLDRNRNMILDLCEDCNSNEVPDLDELQGSHSIWLPASDRAVEFIGSTGVQRHSTAVVSPGNAYDIVVTPDRRVLVSHSGADRISQYDWRGEDLGDLVPQGGGSLDDPTGMVLRDDGVLLVASGSKHAVFAYDSMTGASLGMPILPNTGGLSEPRHMAIAPGNALLITMPNAKILEFDSFTGEFRRLFALHSGNDLRGIVYQSKFDRVLVASTNARIWAFDPATGASMGQFSVGSISSAGGFQGLAIGPDGDVFVAASTSGESAGAGAGTPALHQTIGRVLRYHGRTGWFINAAVQGVDVNTFARGFAFMPDAGNDCNANFRLDECDIAMGFSLDANSNGLPDECEAACRGDCDGSGVLDFFDLLCFQNAFSQGDPAGDCDHNGLFDLNDYSCMKEALVRGCP